ncbi:UNVERIFIED_CONTAM: hypothetical protein Sindi_1268600 [Sesamum indicum]
MGPQRRLEIYVGFESPSIIRYLEPMIGDQFTARYLDCQFNETVFLTLGGVDNEIKRKDIAWNATSMSFMDPRTNDSELEVQRIIHLQSVANRLPEALVDTKRVTKSHISAENIPARIEVPEAILNKSNESESQIRRKRGRPRGSKDANSRKRKEHIVSFNHDANVTTSAQRIKSLKRFHLMTLKVMSKILRTSVAIQIMDEDENDPQTMENCRHRND